MVSEQIHQAAFEDTNVEFFARTRFYIRVHPSCQYIRILKINGCLLGSFESATNLLSSEKNSSFVTAFPVLRCIKNKIGDEKLFQFVNKSSIEKSEFKSEFYGQYGNADFFPSVIRDLNSCRRLLYDEFIDRFKEMKIEIMWTTMLDPRFNLRSNHWKDYAEKKMVKELLIKNVEQIAVQEVRTIHNNHIESESVFESKTDDMFLGEKKVLFQ